MELVIVKQPRVFPNQLIYRVTKRVIDVALCLLVLPFALPLIAICALAIILDSPGPVFFVQERFGKGGCPFRIFKLRTMKVNSDDRSCHDFMKAYVRGEISDCEEEKEIFKPAYTHLLTRVGRILRKTSLDELPQLFNVLKGEMSIVGPRPNVLWEVEEYHPWHHERLEVLPGITGLAQVRGRSCIDFNTLVRFDIEYIEKKNLVLDLRILWWTAKEFIQGKGAM